MNVSRLFKLRKPCANCPFNKSGAIPLLPGRLDGIKNELLANDSRVFFCHKTLSSIAEEPSENSFSYAPVGNESYCSGAMAWLHAKQRHNVAMRLGIILGLLNVDDLDDALKNIRIDN